MNVSPVFPSQIGSFFGTIDSILMRTLVNNSLFTFKKTFDYQSLCDPKKESQAAAGLRSVYVVSYISQSGLDFYFSPLKRVGTDARLFARFDI